jgi:hypothetical protein
MASSSAARSKLATSGKVGKLPAISASMSNAGSVSEVSPTKVDQEVSDYLSFGRKAFQRSYMRALREIRKAKQNDN